ncbi:uncharacterized protein LOC130648598 [Hydractinia symbiolongicarpus]|uniref:uncharacterized protein LOC130648598 n=1 Tax=Hydractinia symbiolongicarpus TaxID=13093 RepID=UPI00254D562F|nr:uncharacterized protein LOC130648598 [Hydractinia symbiolongicarpus]
MDFRANKSRSIVIIKGKSLNSTPFALQKPADPTDFSSYIPSIHSMPVRFLGRIMDGSISDRKATDELEKLSAGVSIIDKSFYKGPQKLWILQHLLIPRIQWPLLIYEVSMSCVGTLVSNVSVFIRKWLNLHHSTTNLCLYDSSSPCSLPIKSLTSILKSAKISGHLLLRDSKDPLVSAAVSILKAGRWSVSNSVRIAEAELKIKEIIGLGLCPKPKGTSLRQSHSFRKLVSVTAKEIDGEKDISRALQLQVQGSWTRWDNYIKNDLSWKSLLAMPPNLLSFCLSSTYDVLPFPSNLRHWRICTESFCFLCGKQVCTTAHILGACKTALTQGRFTFRHDSVLRELSQLITTFSKSISSPVKHLNNVKFVKAGGHSSSKKSKPVGLLHLATDWLFLSDLNGELIFPGHIAITSLRPDLVLYSNNSKRVILIELTCPCEENMETWHSKTL